jgi:hypothetical protein
VHERTTTTPGWFHSYGFRLLFHAIKPKSGWLFPKTVGGSLDLDNLADRVIKPGLKEPELRWTGGQGQIGEVLWRLAIWRIDTGMPHEVIKLVNDHPGVTGIVTELRIESFSFSPPRPINTSTSR